MLQTIYTQPEVATRNVWLDYLRSFITVLVVAHHAALAYTTFAHFDTTTYIYSTHPVVDDQRWVGMDLFQGFNDIFFMSLMFFISGLFVYRSIQKKGRSQFLTDRFKRLFIPFLVGVTLIMPLAYIPSYYLVHHRFSVADFVSDYIFHQQWPVGPPWFLWVLFVFNVLAVWIPSGFYTTLSDAIRIRARKPALLLGILFLLVAVAFIPLSLWVGPFTWTGWGPFDFQVNRVLLYFFFFVLGVCLGSGAWESYLFTANRLFNKSWVFWVVLCVAAYLLARGMEYEMTYAVKAGTVSITTGYLLYDLSFVASCLASSLACLALFKWHSTRPIPLWSDLSANAFGIYLIHYVGITWLQFALLPVALPVAIKFLVVFVGSWLASWLLTHQLRKIPVVKQYL